MPNGSKRLISLYVLDVLTMRGNNSYVTYSSYFSIVNNNATSTNATAQQ